VGKIAEKAAYTIECIKKLLTLHIKPLKSGERIWLYVVGPYYTKTKFGSIAIKGRF